MFASLPKLADKNFVVAFLVPTLAFGLALAWAFPQLAALTPVEKALGSQKDLTDLTLVVAAVWFGAVALLLANHVIYRTMEGYLGPLADPGRKARKVRLWTARMNALAVEFDLMQAMTPGAARAVASASYNRRLADLRRRFPPSADQVVGTRFGNINRAFEVYSGKVYGVDAITIWPRLSGVIPPAFQTVLSDARAQVDCFLNLTALALVFAAIEFARCGWSLATAFWDALPAQPDLMAPLIARTFAATDWASLAPAVVAGAFAALAYRMLLASALLLGDQFKAAFDLYLGALPKQLGYELPTGWGAQRDFWRRLRSSYDYMDKAPQTHRSKTPPAAPGAATAKDGDAADAQDAEEKDADA